MYVDDIGSGPALEINGCVFCLCAAITAAFVGGGGKTIPARPPPRNVDVGRTERVDKTGTVLSYTGRSSTAGAGFTGDDLTVASCTDTVAGATLSTDDIE